MQSLLPCSPGRGEIIVFLDIDGVLRPFDFEDDGKRVFPSRCLESLAYLFQQVPEIKLVLSSTWRVQQTFIDMITNDFRNFGGNLRHVEFVDITNPALHTERQHEIYDWLCRNQKGVAAWIALDDEELLEGEVNQRYCHLFEHHVVKTDSHIGMTMQDAELAIRLIQNQLKPMPT